MRNVHKHSPEKLHIGPSVLKNLMVERTDILNRARKLCSDLKHKSNPSFRVDVDVERSAASYAFRAGRAKSARGHRISMSNTPSFCGFGPIEAKLIRENEGLQKSLTTKETSGCSQSRTVYFSNDLQTTSSKGDVAMSSIFMHDDEDSDNESMYRRISEYKEGRNLLFAKYASKYESISTSANIFPAGVAAEGASEGVKGESEGNRVAAEGATSRIALF